MKEHFNQKTATECQQMCGKCSKPYVKGFCGCPRIFVMPKRKFSP